VTSTELKAKIAHIRVEKGRAGLYYATSPDLKGLLVAESTTEALEKAIPNAIVALCAACGVNIVVTALDGHSRLFCLVYK